MNLLASEITKTLKEKKKNKKKLHLLHWINPYEIYPPEPWIQYVMTIIIIIIIITRDVLSCVYYLVFPEWTHLHQVTVFDLSKTDKHLPLVYDRVLINLPEITSFIIFFFQSLSSPQNS